jgi:capsule polysaccharide modification protein KpsS
MSQWLMFSAEAQMSEKPFSDGLPEAFRRASGGFFEKSSISEPIFRAENCGNKKIRLSLHPQQGGLAQLARALAWHARGHEFESRILHHKNGTIERWSRFSVYVSGRIGRTRHKRHKRHKSIRAGLHPQH